jgi:hypothetical protein
MAAPIVATLWTVATQRSHANTGDRDIDFADDAEIDLDREVRVVRLNSLANVQYVLCIAAAAIDLLVVADLIQDHAPGSFVLALSALVLWVWLVTEMTRIAQAPDVMIWRRLQLRAIQADRTRKVRGRAEKVDRRHAHLTAGVGLMLMVFGTAIALAADWRVAAISGSLTAACYLVMLIALVTSSDGYLREGRWDILAARIGLDAAFALTLVLLTLTAYLLTGPEAWSGQPWRVVAGATIQVATYAFLVAGALGRGPAHRLARFTLDAAARRDRKRRARLRA